MSPQATWVLRHKTKAFKAWLPSRSHEAPRGLMLSPKRARTGGWLDPSSWCRARFNALTVTVRPVGVQQRGPLPSRE